MIVKFWVTNDCNLKCNYCYEGQNKAKKYMSKNVIDKAINYTLNYIKKLNTNDLIVSIHGGEPFLAFEIIEYIVNCFKREMDENHINISFATTTNGTIMNSKIKEFIIKDIKNITFSIDGARETHDMNRQFKNGNGTHHIVLRNAKEILKYIPNMRIRTTFDSKSARTLYEDVKFLIEGGFKCIVPAPNLFDKNWDEESLYILQNQVKKLKEYLEYKENVVVSILDKDLHFKKSCCVGGKSGFDIDPDGNLYPCILSVGINEFCIGNLKDGMDENKLEKILSYSRKINPECNGCDLYQYCDGARCKIINKIITGDYLLPPPMQCAMEKIRYKFNIKNIFI